jgi:hypothetical protein
MNTYKVVKLNLPLCLTKHLAMKRYWGRERIAPRILDLGTRWRWVVSFTSQSLYPQRKSPRYRLYRRLGEPQSWSGHGGEEKNSQPLPGIEPYNPDRPARTLTSIPNELSRFPWRPFLYLINELMFLLVKWADTSVYQKVFGLSR